VFSEILWLFTILSIAGLYAIFYRAIRRVFHHASTTRGDFLSGVRVALAYTALYTFWIFALFIL
jgi:hypothetical protein